MRISLSTTSISLALSSILISSAILADEQAFEFIEVWAQKQQQPIMEVPMSLQVLTDEQLQSYGQFSLEEIEHHLPGVFASPNSSASKLFIRGIGSQGNAGMDQNASVYIDNIYHGRSRIMKASLFDIQQLELLKGPQSLHFGLNSTAGAFSLRTQGASVASTNGYLQTQFGDNALYGFGLVKNIAINDSTAVRAAMRIKHSDGYWDMIAPDSGEKIAQSDHDERLLRLSGVWHTDALTIRIKGETQETEKQNPYAWQPTGCNNLYGLGLTEQNELNTFWRDTGSEDANPLRVPFTCRDSFIDNELNQYSPASPDNSSSFAYHIMQSQITWRLPTLDIALTSAWYDTEFEFSGNDLSHGANFHRIFASTDNIHQHSQELRFSPNRNQPVNWNAGLYWHDNHIQYRTTDADGRRRMQEQVSLAAAAQNEERFSAFASLEWRPGYGIRIAPGLRWASTKKQFSGTDRVIQVQRQPDAQKSSLSALILSDVLATPERYEDFNSRLRNDFNNETLDFSGLMPTFVLQWELAQNTHAYYKWQKGLKGGGFNFRLNNLDDSNLRYQEESVHAQELGIKGVMPQRQLTYAATLFSSRYRDLQQNSNQGEDGFIGGAFIRNVAKASSDGLEIDISWQASDAWHLSWQSTLLSAEFDSYPGADCTRLQSVVSNTDVASLFGADRAQNCFQDLSGSDMPLAPKLASNLALSYRFTIFDAMQVDTRIAWHYSDEFFTSPHADALRKQDSYHKVNLNISLEPNSEQWKISLYINNLTDELTSRQLGQDGNAAVSGLIDPPRYWFLQGTYKI